MIINDVQYAWSLLFKAVQGVTLKPREVNSVRRIAKDMLTLIPFTIILIIPLSPIGHVLVFSFIQRFFPDFFPSGFTEKRQNLRRLYADIERKSSPDEFGDLLVNVSQDNSTVEKKEEVVSKISDIIQKVAGSIKQLKKST